MKTVERLLAFSLSQVDFRQTPTNSHQRNAAAVGKARRPSSTLTKRTKQMSEAPFSHEKPDLRLSANSGHRDSSAGIHRASKSWTDDDVRTWRLAPTPAFWRSPPVPELIVNGSKGEGFRTPAPYGTVVRLPGPAFESLPRRKPRGGWGWFGGPDLWRFWAGGRTARGTSGAGGGESSRREWRRRGFLRRILRAADAGAAVGEGLASV